MTMRKPARCSAAIAPGVDSLIGSATPSKPDERAVVARRTSPSARSRASCRDARRPARAPATPRCASSASLPSAAAPPSTVADDALAGDRREVGGRPAVMPRSARAGDDRRGERVLARALERRREAQDLRPSVAPRARRPSTRRGLPSVSVPVLSTTSVSTFSSTSSASAFFTSTPAGRAAPDADHDRHRRREAERARARDDQHRDRVHQRVREARLRSDQRTRRRTTSTAATHHRRHEPGRRPRRRDAGSGRGCAARRPTMLDDLREHASPPRRARRA